MNTYLSDHLGLEGLRADHPSRTVPALPIVVHLDVLERLPPHGNRSPWIASTLRLWNDLPLGLVPLTM